MTTKHIFSQQLAQQTVNKYVCSNCWGHLIEKIVDGGVLVECHSCQEETKGFVTKHFVERRKQESMGEQMDTKYMLRKIGVIENPHAGKDTNQLLKEMGF